ncbi:MAG: ABC transporter substrate-binding protein [Opitutales bacterium]
MPALIPLLGCLLLALFSGCATPSKQTLTPVVMQLDWKFNVQFAGLYQAVEQGYFEDEGLAVELKEVPKDYDIFSPVVGHADLRFGCSESNRILMESSGGMPLVALATMFQGSPMGWISLESTGIESVADFRGKKIGVHEDGVFVIDLALRKNGLADVPFETFEVGHSPEALLSGKADLVQGYVLDEFVKYRKVSPEPLRIVMAKDNGYLAYSQVIYADKATVAKYPEKTRGFLRAVQKGWEYVDQNREATVDLVLSKYSPQLDRDYQLESLDEVMKLVKPEGMVALSPMDRAVWEGSMNEFIGVGLMEEAADLDALVTTEYNP